MSLCWHCSYIQLFSSYIEHLFLMDGILLFASDEIMIHFAKENSLASVQCDVILVFWTDTSWFQHTVFQCKFMLNVILISSIGFSWIYSFYWGLNDLRLKHHIWLACIIPVYITIHPSFHIFLYEYTCNLHAQGETQNSILTQHSLFLMNVDIARRSNIHPNE